MDHPMPASINDKSKRSIRNDRLLDPDNRIDAERTSRSRIGGRRTGTGRFHADRVDARELIACPGRVDL